LEKEGREGMAGVLVVESKTGWVNQSLEGLAVERLLKKGAF